MNDSVRMEYTGPNAGPISFVGADRTRIYRGADNATNKYADVHPDDVPVLEATGRWRVVPVEQIVADASAPPTVSTSEAADRLGLQDSADVRALIDAGQLDAEKDERGQWRISYDAIDARLATLRAEAEAADLAAQQAANAGAEA